MIMQQISGVKGEFVYATKKPAFAMMMAIMIVMLIALGSVLLLNNAAQGTKSVGDNYLRAQAELLAESATEYAVMRVQGFDDESNNCLNNVNIAVKDATGGIQLFDINVTISYTFKNAKPTGTCNALEQNTNQPTRMLIDTTVTTNTDTNITTEPIKVHRRSWQKL